MTNSKKKKKKKSVQPILFNDKAPSNEPCHFEGRTDFLRRDPPREMSDDHESDKLNKPSEAALLVQFLGWASFEDITLRDAFTIAQDRHSLYHD